MSDMRASVYFKKFYTCGEPNDNPCNQKSFVGNLFDSFRQKAPPAAEPIKEDPKPICPAKEEEKIVEEVEECTCENHCFIKEQNPLDPCCCEEKTEADEEDDSPCPTDRCEENSRVPTCGCDLCRKNGYHGCCCGRQTYVQGAAKDPPQLEQA